MSTILKAATTKGLAEFTKGHAQRALPAITVLMERSCNHFLHGKPRAGLARRDRRQWKYSKNILHHQRAALTRNEKYFNTHHQTSVLPMSHFVDRKIPSLITQVRQISNQGAVTDEAGYQIDSELHKRAAQIHMHPRGPIVKLLNSAKKIINRDLVPSKESEYKILDIGPISGEPAISLAQEFPQCRIYSIDSSPDVIREIQEKADELGLTNVVGKTVDMNIALDYFDCTFDLVTSCYGLEESSEPKSFITEIHRVLKPGGTMLTTTWRHLGTDAILDFIMKKVTGEKSNRCPGRETLKKPFILEDLIQKDGMWLLNMEKIQYPMKLSASTESHGHAFDFVSLPVKKQLGELVRSGAKPYAFEDASAAFEEAVKKGNLIHMDSDGGLIVEDNQYKFVVARRRHEDDDILKQHKTDGGTDKRRGKVLYDNMDTLKIVDRKFESFLSDTSYDTSCPPWKQIIERVQQIVDSKYQNNVLILDLSPPSCGSATLLAKNISNSRVDVTCESSDIVNQMNTKFQQDGLLNLSAGVARGLNLSNYKTNSFDLVTSSFSLPFASNSAQTLEDVHRLLKPGGSLLITTWESISLERIAKKVIAGVMGDKHVPERISHHLHFSEPLKLERLIESSGLSVNRVDKFEFPFKLTGDNLSQEYAFESATLLIRPWLEELEKTGTNPHAFEDAKRTFQKLVQNNELLGTDTQGNLLTVRNRFKTIVARRKFEDEDGILERATE